MAYDVMPLLRAAVERGGEDPDGIFHWENFAAAIKDEFRLKSLPTCEWSTRVLKGLAEVRRHDGFAIRGCHWQLAQPHDPSPSSDTILRQF